MPYHIDEENSELVFEVREGNKLVIKLKSNTGGGGSDIYLIKTGDETTPTEKNTFSSLRILKEIEQLHETILQEVGSDLSVWEIKQAENGEKYISTKYNVVTEKGITAYASGIKDAGSIVDGIPFDNKTIWFNPETGVVEVIGGTGGGSFDSSKMWELLLSDTDEQINISHLADALSGYATEEELRKKWTQDDNKISNWDTAFSWGDHSKSGYAHLANEETFSDIKHFTQGLTVGEGKHKLYEKDGVVYLDGDLAVTGGLTAYALGDTDISTIMDGVVVDGTTIKKENGQLVAIVGSGSSFDKSAMWAALSDDTTEQINKSHLTTALSGYATTTQLNTKWTQDNTKISNWDDAYSWGNHASAGYAKQTSLDAVSSKLNDFLEGSDTDSIINKWKELESFLSGMTESDNLADILSTKADKSFVTSELTKYVTLTTPQTISGAKTFTSLLTTAAIKAKGDINTPNVRTSDSVYINGIRLYKSAEGNLILDGNLLVTGGVTAYSDGSSSGGSSGGLDVDLMWEILAGTGTQQINKTHLTDALNGYATQSWVTSQNYLKSVSIATISDLNSSWDALLKAAPSVYVTRHPTISEVTNKQSLVIKLNSGATEGTNMFTYNATAAKTVNITPSAIGAALSSHNHSWSQITSGKPTTLSGYGITDAYTKTESDSRYVNVSGDTMSGNLTFNAGCGIACNGDLAIGRYFSTNIYLQTTGGIYFTNKAGTNYKVWHAGNDGSGSGLDADLLDGVQLLQKGSNSGIMRSWARGKYTTVNQYFGNGAVVVIDPAPTDSNDLWANTTIFSVGDAANRNWQMAFGYGTDKIKVRINNETWGSWRTLAYLDSTVSNADKLDGIHANGLLTALSSSSATNLSLTVGGTAKTIADLYATQAVNSDTVDNYHAIGTSGNVLRKRGQSVALTTAAWCRLAKYSMPSFENLTDVSFLLHSAYSGRFCILNIESRAGAYVKGNIVLSYGMDTSKIRIYYDDTKKNVELYYLSGEGYSVIIAELIYSTERNGAWNNAITMYNSDVTKPSYTNYINPTVSSLQNNVASATKLQTPRTLWGRPFDGTANVSGDININGNIINVNEIKNSLGTYLRVTSAGGLVISPNSNGDLSIRVNGTIGNESIFVKRSTNYVGIGTSAPSYKLHVNGSTYTTDMYINGVRVYKPQDKVLKIEGNLLVTGGITQYSIDSGDYPNIEDIVSDSIKVDNISVKKDNGIIKSCSLNLRGLYTGGEEKPINLGGAMFKVTMLKNTTMGLTSDSYWNDVIWISSYGGSDVANSQILAFSKNGMKRIYHARQSFSSGSYGGFDTIAYISDTVAAATKLETSRMIFGQSFDGTQDIDGDITTSGSLLNGSDARNKNILDTINCISLDNIVSLPIIKFRWNNRAFKDDGRTRYGTIAQEVQKILPELVYDRDNSLYMDYAVAGTIFSISVAKSLKGTKSEVERLKERVRILEEMLNIKQNGNEESDTLAN